METLAISRGKNFRG